jgi:hypothetical protein
MRRHEDPEVRAAQRRVWLAVCLVFGPLLARRFLAERGTGT